MGMRPMHSPLTGREWEIVDLLATGTSTQQIAEELVLTEATVYTHVKNILRKLRVSSRADAVAAADRLRRQALERNTP
jgi:DNA-binding NarL/FixJ family response regulator